VKGLVLAGGHGTRLRPLTYTRNKHMLPIANQPILYFALRHLVRADIRDVAIVLGPINEGIREQVGNGKAFGLNVAHIEQGEPKGLAHAVLCAREFLEEEPFLMYLGDNLLESGVTAFLDRYRDFPVDAVIGGYLFTTAIHSVIRELRPSARGELEITDAIWNLWKVRERVAILQVEGWWKDTWHPDDLLEANELVLRSITQDDVRIEGLVDRGARSDDHVGIGPRTTVAAGAPLVGPTIVGSDTQIGPGAVIGPFTAVGNRVRVLDSSVKRSIVLDGPRIEGVSVVNSLFGRGVDVISNSRTSREISVILGDSSKVSM
jgi:glucose-1-phosphate thymidylyltransferase